MGYSLKAVLRQQKRALQDLVCGEIPPPTQCPTDQLRPGQRAEAWRDAVERAAIIEMDGRIPRAWALAYATLLARSVPAGISSHRWHQAMNDAGRLLDDWAQHLVQLGWTIPAVFDIPSDVSSEQGLGGLIWLLKGRRVLAVTSVTVTARQPDGSAAIFHASQLGRLVTSQEGNS